MEREQTGPEMLYIRNGGEQRPPWGDVVDQSLECNEEVNREAIEASQVEATPIQRTWGRNKPVMFREEQEDLRQTWNEGRENGRR